MSTGDVLYQTEMIDGECHDHTTVSKINLVDLAGSERQVMAKTTGDRLRVSVSFHLLSYSVMLFDDVGSFSSCI